MKKCPLTAGSVSRGSFRAFLAVKYILSRLLFKNVTVLHFALLLKRLSFIPAIVSYTLLTVLDLLDQ